MNKIIRAIRIFVHDLMVFILPKSMLSHLMSCEDVSKILVEKRSLPLKKNIRVKLHILICQCCTDYKHQLQIIEENSKKLGNLELTPEQKDQINKSKEQLLERLK